MPKVNVAPPKALLHHLDAGWMRLFCIFTLLSQNESLKNCSNKACQAVPTPNHVVIKCHGLRSTCVSRLPAFNRKNHFTLLDVSVEMLLGPRQVACFQRPARTSGKGERHVSNRWTTGHEVLYSSVTLLGWKSYGILLMISLDFMKPKGVCFQKSNSDIARTFFPLSVQTWSGQLASRILATSPTLSSKRT